MAFYSEESKRKLYKGNKKLDGKIIVLRCANDIFVLADKEEEGGGEFIEWSGHADKRKIWVEAQQI